MVSPDAVPFWDELPYSLRILLENGIRAQLDQAGSIVKQFEGWLSNESSIVNYYPGRVLMQDLTGVPALVDLAAMRDASKVLGSDPEKINPLCRVDLVVDHSVSVNHYGSQQSYEQNVVDEVAANAQRYSFLKWSQQAFEGVRIIPTGNGICHQVNIEYLATVAEVDQGWARPDTLVGLDSHTTMVNGLSVLGWGVGGIEAEAAMLGQAIRMVLPKVVGVELRGQLQEGVTATDLVLAMTQFLRGVGVVGQFVEFHGEGLKSMDLATRATVSNMAPEFGATCAFFPSDAKTIEYLNLTGRDPRHIAFVESYLKAARLYHQGSEGVRYSQDLVFDLSAVTPCVAGPSRPEQMLPISQLKSSLGMKESSASLQDGSVVIAAITSCTNTSNPSVLIGAGLLAQKALALGLSVPSWVKTSLAPGSKVVMRYLQELGLDQALADLGFHLVGFGCTTCIGNSGPLDAGIAKEIQDKSLKVSAVLSGNRNFEGRVHPQTQLNYLASPPLVVAYALAGTVNIDLTTEPIAYVASKPVYLKDLWPSETEIQHAIQAVKQDMFVDTYNDILNGIQAWQDIECATGDAYQWDQSSTYIQPPPFLRGVEKEPGVLKNVKGAAILALLGDHVTTDHISPAGHIPHESAAGLYLSSLGLDRSEFNSYGSRRGNAEVMVRGTLANTRIKNKMSDKEGGYTMHVPTGDMLSIYDCAMRYRESQTPLVIIAGASYGMGSSRDWAAKGVMMLGVKVVIAESFERIHRTNLLGMGVLPCRFVGQAPKLTGQETIDVLGIDQMQGPNSQLKLIVNSADQYELEACIETDAELEYLIHGGILPYVLRTLV
jgi:aconitate hydratase